jgi:hypothetical protein
MVALGRDDGCPGDGDRLPSPPSGRVVCFEVTVAGAALTGIRGHVSWGGHGRGGVLTFLTLQLEIAERTREQARAGRAGQ